MDRFLGQSVKKDKTNFKSMDLVAAGFFQYYTEIFTTEIYIDFAQHNVL